MKLINNGFDNNFTYFEHNINSNEVPNIFIHGVGLDSTMWLPQKKFLFLKMPLYLKLMICK